MPIYEYRCEACGHQEEFLKKVSEPRLTECPACHKESFTKLLSAAGFQLKGSGWYATDFKSKSAKPAESKADAKPEAKVDSATETKSEPKKAESKSEPKKAESKSETPA